MLVSCVIICTWIALHVELMW